MRTYITVLAVLLWSSAAWAGTYAVSSYTYVGGGGTVAGADAAAEVSSPYVLTDGFVTTQAQIDAAAGDPEGYYVNGGQHNGVIYGGDPHPGVQFDLGAVVDLGVVEIHYVVHIPHGVGAPTTVEFTVDAVPVGSFSGFDTSENVNTYGDARYVLVDLSGQSGQFVTMEFHCPVEWVSLDEVIFYAAGGPEASDYGQRVLATGPIAYYSFDEGAGNEATDLVSRSSAKLLTAVTPVHIGHGIYGSGVDTSAGNVNTHPERTNGVWVGNPGIGVVDGPFAVEWMMRWNGSTLGGNVHRSITDTCTITFEDVDSSSGVDMGLKIYDESGNWAGAILPSSENDPDFTGWHHYVWYRDLTNSANDKLYVDGVENTSWAWRNGFDPSQPKDPIVPPSMDYSNLMIGGWPDPSYGRAFRGEVDECAYYDLRNEADPAATAAVVASHAVSTGAVYVARDPASVTAEIGTTATFSVVAAGVMPITYQWQKDGGDLPGANGSILNLAGVAAGDAGVYRCVLSNAQGGPVTSAGAVLTVNYNPIVITEHPQGSVVVPGQDYVLHVSASGSGTLAYQWKKDGSPLTGAEQSSLALVEVQLADEGNYSCVVTSEYEPTGVESTTAFLDVVGYSGYAQRVMASGPIVYYAFDEDSGDQALEFVSGDPQRFLNCVSPVRISHAGGLFGNAVDTSAGNVATHPERTESIWTNPSTCVPSVAGPFAYEWMMRWNGAELEGDIYRGGGQGCDISFEASAPGEPFGLVIRNVVDGGVINSTPFVVQGEVDFTQWHHFVFVDHDATDQCDLYVDGVPVPGFAWQAAGQDAVMNLYEVHIGGWADEQDGRSFRGDIDECAFYDLSDETNLAQAGAAIASHTQMDGAAHVVTSPASVTVDPGADAALRTVAAGAEPISYQWRRNGVDLVDGPDVQGANDSVLRLSHCQPKGGGHDVYTCVVSNGLGGQTSQEAVVAVACWFDRVADLDGDCLVGLEDLAVFAAQWLTDGYQQAATADEGTGTAGGPLNSLDVSSLTAYGQRVMTSGPFLYYNFDEASGPAEDVVSQSPALDLVAVTPVRTAHAPFGSAVDTSAGNSDVHPTRTNGTWVNASTGIPTLVDSFAVEWMMKWNGYTLGGNISRSPTDSVTITLDDMGEGNMGLRVWSAPGGSGQVSSDIIYAADANPDLEQWHHFVLVDNNGTKEASLYVDGVKRSGWGWGGTTDAQLDISDLRIGGWEHPTYGRAFRGEIDEVAYYDLTGVADVDQAATVIASHGILTGPAYVVMGPQSVHTEADQTVTFTVTAAGAEPIAFEWRKDGQPLIAGPGIVGPDTPVLQLVSVDLEDIGQYSCLVSNSLGSEESAGAALTLACFGTIAGDFDGDCVVDLKDFDYLSGAWRKTSSELNLVFACAADNDLYVVMQDNGVLCPRYDTAGEAITQASEYAGVLLLADDYPSGRIQVDAGLFAQAAAKHLRVYVEYPSMLPDLSLGEPAYQATGAYGAIVERTVVTSNAFEPDLAPMRIMMINDCHYLPVTVTGAHLTLSRVEGYDYAVYGLGAVSHPILFEHPTEQILVSTTKLSQFVTGRYSPKEVWPGVWRMILNWLVDNPTQIDLEWTGEVRTMYGADELLPADAQYQAAVRGTQYYAKSRLFVNPSWPPGTGVDGIPADWPDGDGSAGIGECYISKRIFADGTQAVSRSVRTDCNLEAAMGLACGTAFGLGAEYAQLATTFNDLIFFDSVVQQGTRADPNSPSYGLLSYHTGDVTGLYWGDDNARALLGAIGSAALLNSDRWDESILRGILANFRTTGIYGFRPLNISEAALQANGWLYYWNLPHIDYCPHMEAYIWCTYLWLYDKTGFAPLLDRARTGLQMMMDAYPNWRLEANRYEQERCRMLLPLAWLVRADDTPEHRGWLDTVAQYVIANQDASGAIGQIPGHVVSSNDGYGTGECAIVHEAGDPATDALYSINFAFIGMHEAAAVTGDSAYQDSVDRMADFFIRTQTQSTSHPELDGTWYRGFDYGKWDYWGSDGDAGWGIWTNEIGWTHSWIAATLALRELQSSLWEISATSNIGVHMDDYRPWMLPDEVLP